MILYLSQFTLNYNVITYNHLFEAGFHGCLVSNLSTKFSLISGSNLVKDDVDLSLLDSNLISHYTITTQFLLFKVSLQLFCCATLFP